MVQVIIYEFHVERLTFSINYSILLVHSEICIDMKMLAAYGWCGL